MKNKHRRIFMLLLGVIMATCVAMTACQTETECTVHTDADLNGLCDVCGKTIEPTPSGSSGPALVEVHFESKNQNGVAMVGAQVEIESRNGEKYQGQIQADGTMVMTLPVGNYTVTMSELPDMHLPTVGSFTVQVDMDVVKLEVLDNSPNGSQERPFFIGEEDFDVELTAGSTFYFEIRGGEGRRIVIHNPNVEVSCQGQTYTADANGSVEFGIVVDDPMERVNFTIANKTQEVQQFTVVLAANPGTNDNPYIIEKMGQQDAILVSVGGVIHYSWVATESGKLTLKSDDPSANLTMTCSKVDALGNVSSSTDTGFSNGSTDGVSLYVMQGDRISIRVGLVDSVKEDQTIQFSVVMADKKPIQGLNQPYTVTVKQGDILCYSWVATEAGKLTVSSESWDVVLGMSQIRLNQDGKILDWNDTGLSKNPMDGVSLDVEAGDVITVQVRLAAGVYEDTQVTFTLSME